MTEYNEARPHQGRYCFGKTPMQTFLDRPHHCTGKTDRRTVHRSTGGMNINQPVPAVRQIKYKLYIINASTTTFLPSADVAEKAADLAITTDVDTYLNGRAKLLDWRLRRFARMLNRGKVEGRRIEQWQAPRDAVEGNYSAQADRLDRIIDDLLPRIRNYRVAGRRRSSDWVRRPLHRSAQRQTSRQSKCSARRNPCGCDQSRHRTHGGRLQGRHISTTGMDA